MRHLIHKTFYFGQTEGLVSKKAQCYKIGEFSGQMRMYFPVWKIVLELFWQPHLYSLGVTNVEIDP